MAVLVQIGDEFSGLLWVQMDFCWVCVPDSPADVSAAYCCAAYDLCLNICVYRCIIILIWLKMTLSFPDSLTVAPIRKSQEMLIEIDSSVDSSYIKGYAYTKAVTSKWTFIICSMQFSL